MSFKYLKDKFKRSNEEQDVEEVVIDVEEMQESEGDSELKERLNLVMSRISEIENDIPRIKMGIDTLKSQIQEIRGEIDSLNKTIKDVMMLYEVVSEEINPFRDTSKSNPILSEIQDIKKVIEDLKAEIAQIKADLRLLSSHGMDVESVIYEVLSEGFE